jgi:hypothetical protein
LKVIYESTLLESKDLDTYLASIEKLLEFSKPEWIVSASKGIIQTKFI